MAEQWIIDVLLDMHEFARLNALNKLEEQVQETLRVARAELAHERFAQSAASAARGPNSHG